MSKAKTWFRAKAQANGAQEIVIYDEVGLWGVDATAFYAALREGRSNTKEVVLHINSPGGSVADGTAIYNMLKADPRPVTVIVDGVAASIASVVAMAGDTIQMPGNTFMMIHDPGVIMAGNFADFRHAADTLDKMGEAMALTYAERTGLDLEEIRAMMLAETWMGAAEAVSLGFADEVMGVVKAAVKFDLSNFTAAPAGVGLPRGKSAPQGPSKEDSMTDKATETPEEMEARIRKEVTDKLMAESEAAAKAAAMKAREDAQAELQETVKAISALCAKAGCPDKAAGFIAEGKSIDEVKDALIEAMGLAGDGGSAAAPEVNGRQPGNAPGGAVAEVDTVAIYAKRNATPVRRA